MKFTAPVLPGFNRGRDTYNAAIKTGTEAEYVDYRETSLNGFDGVLVPGGFSLGDYLRSEAVTSVAPIVSEVGCLTSGGKPVLGVCSEFRILTKIGLLPGALLYNDSHLFTSRNEKLRIASNQTPFTNLYGENEVVVYSIAHGEGHYYCTDGMYSELVESNQIILTYEDNPSGSHEHIAGIVNKAGNIYEMIPHSERTLKTLLGADSGVKLFETMINSWREQNV